MGHVIEHIALEIQTLAGMDCGFEMIDRFAIVARYCCEECEVSGDRTVKRDPTERDEEAIVGPQQTVEYGCLFGIPQTHARFRKVMDAHRPAEVRADR